MNTNEAINEAVTYSWCAIPTLILATILVALGVSNAEDVLIIAIPFVVLSAVSTAKWALSSRRRSARPAR